MTTMISRLQFDDFASYMRAMFNDMATAHIGKYHNETTMQEIAVVWNPADVPLDGYPMPENITHIRAEPHKNAMDMGEYLFKHVIKSVMNAAGFKDCSGMFISEMKKGQYACNMGSGYSRDMQSEVYYVMVRANGDLAPAVKAYKEIDDQTLRAYCATALKHYRMGLENESPGAAAPKAPAPGGL